MPTLNIASQFKLQSVASFIPQLWHIALLPRSSSRQSTNIACGSLLQVVLPLLQNEVVATGWVSLSEFLTGLALVQAMPGPLFNFAAYLGMPF